MRICQLFGVFGLVALTSLANCTSFSSSRSPLMDKTGWITHCFGRFLIDLPPSAEIHAGYYLWGTRVDPIDKTPSELSEKINQHEQELKSQQHRKTQKNMFLRRLDLRNGATGLLSWASSASAESYYLHVYATSSPQWNPYYWKVEMLPNKERDGTELAAELVRNLRSREPGEIPNEPGFCMDRAYIAGNSFQDEGFGVGVTFPNHPGAHFELRSSTGAEQDRLLDRVSGFLSGAAKLVVGIDTLRKRERDGAIPADEYLLAGSDKGQRVYTFAWEAQGKDESITEPQISAALGVLERDADDDGNPPPPAFKSDKEALDLWDTIIDSIRLRPVSSSPHSANNGSPPDAPTGMPASKPVAGDYALEEFLAELKPKDNWMDDL